MILVTNGDSWTQGDSPAQNINWEAEKTIEWYEVAKNFGDPYEKCDQRIRYKFYDSEVWPKTLGRSLGIETLNGGRLGADNYSIMRRTINILNGIDKPCFVVVGWTAPSRIPVFTVKEGQNRLHLEQARPYISGVEFLYSNAVTYEDMSLLCYFTLQEYLKNRGFKFLFFNAFDYIPADTESSYLNLIDNRYWMESTFHKGHFKEYILEKYNLLDWGESEYFTTSHPRDNSHKAWGKYLFSYINDNGIL